MEPELREAVAAASRRLAAEGLVPGTAGNVSARTGELVAITPTGARLGELEPDEVAVVELDGRQVGGTLAPTSELELHLLIHAQRGDGAVTVAADADAAVEGALLLEWACGLYLNAAQLGEPRVLDEAAQQKVIEQAVKLRYGTTRAADAEPGA